MESSVRGSVAGGTFRGVSEPFGRAPAAPTPEPSVNQKLLKERLNKPRKSP